LALSIARSFPRKNRRTSHDTESAWSVAARAAAAAGSVGDDDMEIVELDIASLKVCEWCAIVFLIGGFSRERLYYNGLRRSDCMMSDGTEGELHGVDARTVQELRNERKSRGSGGRTVGSGQPAANAGSGSGAEGKGQSLIGDRQCAVRYVRRVSGWG
jgi:hypothetical protein